MLISSNYDVESNDSKDSTQNDYTSAESRESLLRTLMRHRQCGGETESFCKTAIASLLKKLWARGDELDNLMIAITKRGREPTKCVTVQRSLDGRLQVAGRKFFPHVVYAKIWRWPEIFKNEMCHIRSCRYAFDLKCTYVCVNPYHYERYDPSDVHPLFSDIPSLMARADRTSAEISSTDDDTLGGTGGGGGSENSYGIGTSPSYIDVSAMQQIYLPDKSPLPAATYPHQDVDVLDEDWRSLQPENPSVVPTNDGTSWKSAKPGNQEIYENFASMESIGRTFVPNDEQILTKDLRMDAPSYHDLGLHLLGTDDPGNSAGVRENPIDDVGIMRGAAMDEFYGLTTDSRVKPMIQNDFNALEEPTDITGVNEFGGCLMQESTMNQLFGQPTNSGGSIESGLEKDLEAHQEASQSLIQLCSSGISATTPIQSYGTVTTSQWTNDLSQNPNLSDDFVNPSRLIDENAINENFERLSTSLPILEHWCSVDYFELHNHVGETFKVKRGCPTITIDGYVNPSETQRFCLGALTNVHRTEQSEKVRLHIGKGVTLDVRDNGDVWLSCKSENSVFLKSHYLDAASGLSSGNYVHKIHPSVCVKVFDLRECYGSMRKHAMDAQMAAASQAAVVAGASVTQNVGGTAGIGVDELRRFCILSLSFVKGWGHDYPRPSIKDTPCWIEVHLHRGLQLLDDILHNISTNVSRSIE